MSCIVITEATSGRKHKCPYCEERQSKMELISHIETEHEDMIPEGFSAPRIVFNTINKKEFGRCIICKEETKWDDKTWKYKRFCDKKSCYHEYVKMVKGRMVKVHGKEHLLGDASHQTKMLANRKISGKYKFQDGEYRTYCGSYEKKALEFYNKAMSVESKDIITPGPVIEYEFEGKKHQWITDIYYVPANLVHDVKDGGSNPNNRNMEEYRAKQLAKEAAIIEQGQYNYIRLTDNNFHQLLLILAELKEAMISEDGPKVIAHVNEGSAVAGALANTGKGVYIIPRMIDNVFVDTLLSVGNTFEDMYKIDESKIDKASISDLDGYSYCLFEYCNDDKELKLNKILETKEEVGKDFFYETLAECMCLTPNQIIFDNKFKVAVDAFTESKNKISVNTASLIREFNRLKGSILEDGIVVLENSKTIDNIHSTYNNIQIMENVNGYYAYNSHNKKSSGYYNTPSHIPDLILSLVNNNKA